MKLSIKKALLGLTLAGITLTQVQAQAPSNVKEVRNELGIMLNILQASLRQNNNKNIRFKAESVTYLVNQGVVFDIDSNNRGNVFSFDLGNMLSNIVVPPVPPVNGNARHIEIEFDEEGIEETIRQAFEHDNDYAEEARDKMRELSERQRDLSWQQREYDRSRRDLEFEKRSAEGDRRNDIDKELSELAKELITVEAKRAELEKYTAQLAQEQAKLAQERDAAKKQLYSQSLAVFEETIGNMLCRYGAGLKSLPENENISFVLSDFAEAEKDSVLRSHDKVYVFKYKDVKSCVIGKSNKEQLLAAATTYLF
jgi:vacuolar-type H+-ATPase subunit I/STV1